MKMVRILTLAALLILISAFAVFQFIDTEPEPQMMSPTLHRVDCILRCFDEYHNALSTDAGIEAIYAAADRVISIFRYAWASDWLIAMEIMLERGESIDHLLELFGSRVASARYAGDGSYEEELAYARPLRENEVQAQILQMIHESIEYFENKLRMSTPMPLQSM